jgi:hypothetical protein
VKWMRKITRTNSLAMKHRDWNAPSQMKDYCEQKINFVCRRIRPCPMRRRSPSWPISEHEIDRVTKAVSELEISILAVVFVVVVAVVVSHWDWAHSSEKKMNFVLE